MMVLTFPAKYYLKINGIGKVSCCFLIIFFWQFQSFSNIRTVFLLCSFDMGRSKKYCENTVEYDIESDELVVANIV